MSSNKRDRLAADEGAGGPGDRFRVIVTGDRAWQCDELATRVVARLIERYGRERLVLIHGAATGVDSAFDRAAIMARVEREPHPADWKRLGKRAGPVRNGEMATMGADICIAVHRFLMNSKGTRDCCNQTIAAGIPTWLIDSEGGEPRRLTAEDPRLG
jgi:hypothetical protein